MQKLKTHAQARAWFDEQGLSIAEWARQHGFGASLVRTILDGKKACKRGQSHQIAVLLGLKAGVITRGPEQALQRGPGRPRTKAATTTSVTGSPADAAA